MDIKAIVNRSDTLGGRIFDYFVQSLIVLSIVTFSVETLPGLEDNVIQKLEVLESIIITIFTLEYFLRLYAADKKLSYVFSFYGIIDLAAIIPFYISSGIDLRSIRIFRMFRLIQILKLLRYNRAIRRYARAFSIIKEELILFAVLTLMLLYLSAVGIYHFEHKAQPEDFKSIFHCLWWAISTLTTVGYGDIYPVTVGGKIFTFFILVIGLGIVAVPAGLLAAALSKAKIDDQDKK